jgi:hypothetical protein
MKNNLKNKISEIRTISTITKCILPMRLFDKLGDTLAVAFI